MKVELRIFVYGTLKKGFSNHQAYCEGVSQIVPARLCARLFKLNREIPVMIVPDSEILALGSADPDMDVRLLAANEIRGRRSGGCRPVGESFMPSRFQWQLERKLQSENSRDWKMIDGEVLYFNDPITRLPLIDGLEEFQPGGPSTYLRVLVRVILADGSNLTAWTYIAGFDTAGLEEFNGEKWFPDEPGEL